VSTPKTAKQIVTELKMPEYQQSINAEYSKFATRILWMDDQVVEGAFHMSTSWYLSPRRTFANAPHVHESDEILGFFGSDPADPYDLGGEIEIWLEDDKHTIDRSCMIFIPAGMKHCPLVIKRVDRPIFHYSVITGRTYELTEDAKDADE